MLFLQLLENNHREGGITHFDLIHEMDSCLFKNGYLQTGRKANEICAESEPGSLSCSNTHARADSIKDGKHNGGENSEGGNLIQREGLLGDKDGRGGNHETLDQILNNAVNNFSKSVAHHVSIFSLKKKTHLNSKEFRQGNEFKA